jgi:hypothetical protein
MPRLKIFFLLENGEKWNLLKRKNHFKTFGDAQKLFAIKIHQQKISS